jgi:crossover junction endodeoxyribonuclease RusA
VVEFVVLGTPSTAQTGRARAKRRAAWKEKVAAAARARWQAAPLGFGVEASVVIVYFHVDRVVADVDSIIKPILDALTGVVYMDDKQVVQVTARRTPLSGMRIFPSGNAEVVAGLAKGDDFVWAAVRGAPAHETLP